MANASGKLVCDGRLQRANVVVEDGGGAEHLAAVFRTQRGSRSIRFCKNYLGIVEKGCFLLHERTEHLQGAAAGYTTHILFRKKKKKRGGNLSAQTRGHARASDAEQRGLKRIEQGVAHKETAGL